MIALHNHELEDWAEALPTPFRMDGTDLASNAGNTTDVASNLVKMLRLRYYNIRMLIHRPVVERALSALNQCPESTLESSKGVDHFATFCQPNLHLSIESSVEIISIANSFESGKLGLGMWWTLLYFGNLSPQPQPWDLLLLTGY